MQNCPDPTYHRTCWDSGGRDCCSRVLPRRSKSSRPLVKVGLGEDVPASALTGAAATTGVMLSSLLSDDCRKSAQEPPPSRVPYQHQQSERRHFLTYSFCSFHHPPHQLLWLPACYLEAVPATAVTSLGRMGCWIIQACQE